MIHKMTAMFQSLQGPCDRSPPSPMSTTQKMMERKPAPPPTQSLLLGEPGTPPDECLDQESDYSLSSILIEPLPFRQVPPRRKKVLWTCCSCSRERISINYVSCPSCSTPRCCYCEIKQVRINRSQSNDLSVEANSTMLEIIGQEMACWGGLKTENYS
ncbi:hypothetical protein EDB81DRAFT_808711 [Dactylonectria macrodidyma]|uniref:Uncharacterized protein n=1 Tax=Dactylonectria macrodidyma TaxID=307937 RepID=A0A9P9IS23_9HYPO|nr:hypothetical protein EDB81DRAFT_808711 [Dactylonectria macrodidyma]